jgi:hypothetical protein
MKVVAGFALPYEPIVRWHGREIRAGYADVGVDKVVPGYESLELDIPGPEEETTLGEVLGGDILWDKKSIVFPCSTPRRPPYPPIHRKSAPPSPPLYEDRDNYHSPSPSRSLPPHQPPSSPQRTNKSKRQYYGKFAALLSITATLKKRRVKKVKVPPPVEKLSYDNTPEELEADVRADVKR